MSRLDRLAQISDKIISGIFIFNAFIATIEWLSTSKTITSLNEVILDSIMWIGCFITVLLVYYAFLVENNRRFKNQNIPLEIANNKQKCDILLSFTCSIGFEITVQLMKYLPIINNIPIYLCMFILAITMYLMSKILKIYNPIKKSVLIN